MDDTEVTEKNASSYRSIKTEAELYLKIIP